MGEQEMVTEQNNDKEMCCNDSNTKDETNESGTTNQIQETEESTQLETPYTTNVSEELVYDAMTPSSEQNQSSVNFTNNVEKRNFAEEQSSSEQIVHDVNELLE